VDKLRIRRSRSGTVKVLIFLDIPVASGALRLDQLAPAVLVRVLPPPFPTYTYDLPYRVPCLQEMSNGGPPGRVPPPLKVAGPPVNSGMSADEDIEDLASRYLHKPSSHVDKLRIRRSRSGVVKVLILLEIDDTM
jgi:hypothetical protein